MCIILGFKWTDHNEQDSGHEEILRRQVQVW